MLSIYNKISDYIIVLNNTGEIKFCNTSFLNRLNYNDEDILNINISKIINEKHNINEIVKKSGEINIDLEFYSKSNELVTINSNISLENYNNEKSIFIIGKEKESKTYNMEILEDVLDNINFSIFVLDEKGKYIYVNKSFEDILNKKREDIIGTYNCHYWKYEDYKQLELNNKEVIENKSPKIFNEKLFVGNNTTNWYESYKAPVFDKNNKLKYIISTTKNVNLYKVITEELYKNYNRITMENGLKDNRNNVNLNNILVNIGENILDYTNADGMSVLIYDKDKESLVPTVKLKNGKKFLENIKSIPLKITEINSNKYKDYLNCIIDKNTVKKISTVDYNCIDEIRYVGTYVIELFNEFIGLISISYTNGNAPKYNCDEYMKYICNNIAIIIKNIRLANEVYTENKKRLFTEKELERYLNVSADLVSIVGKNGYLKKISPNWINVLGWTEEELMSTNLIDILHPEDVKRFKGRMALDKLVGKVVRELIRFRHKDGHYINLEWSSEYLSEEEVYITTARDITRKLEIEKEKRNLEEAVEVELLKNELFSNISHEFRTPINIILGTVQVINKNIEQNNINLESLNKYTKYIKQNSYRLLRLVNNLIDISKMDTGMYELRCSNQNIINIIEDITLSVADYTKNNKINLVFDTDSEEVITYCDPDKIERIMLNILSNAIKFTPENGFIDVSINSTESEVVVSIKDSGVGIPKDKLDVIFDRFGQVEGSFNRKAEGSGIGLSLVKNLVELHGGNIKVYSKINEGTEFIFTIPIVKIAEDTVQDYDVDRKVKHVERCDIEFSDIYSI